MGILIGPRLGEKNRRVAKRIIFSSRLLAGFENPTGWIWFGPLIVGLVIPDGYCDRECSPGCRLTCNCIRPPLSHRLKSYIGLEDCDIGFRQPIIDLPIDRRPMCAGEGFDLHLPAPKECPGTPPGAYSAR